MVGAAQERWLDFGQLSNQNQGRFRGKSVDRVCASDHLREQNPKWPKRYSLEMSITGFKERDGPWYLTEHSVVKDKVEIDRMGRSDWADWSQSGDLLFAMDGCLYRVLCKGGILTPLEDAKKIADFSGLRFEPCEAPLEARRWPKRLRRCPIQGERSPSPFTQSPAVCRRQITSHSTPASPHH